jgi:hypothetical protein
MLRVNHKRPEEMPSRHRDFLEAYNAREVKKNVSSSAGPRFAITGFLQGGAALSLHQCSTSRLSS